MIHLRGGLSRRSLLQGSVGLAALALPGIGRAARDRKQPARGKSVIVLLQEGGMSHLETWDPKPDAPAEIRGSFRQIATNNPELIIGEHTPLLAKQAHLYNVVRTVTMENARRDHSPGLHWLLTGYDNQAAGVALERVNREPSIASIINKRLRGASPSGLPVSVTVPTRNQLGGRINYTGATGLGAAFEPFESGPVPKTARAAYQLPVGLVLDKRTSVRQLEDRRALLESFDRLQREQNSLPEGKNFSEYQEQVFDLLLGGKGKRAFDINRESPETRALYGNSEMGQGTLLARRLLQAGVRYVLVNYSKNNSWDTHNNNFRRLEKTLLPQMDRAVSALLTDLERTGMLDDTIVLLMGEMGRTPLINKNSGRDHWPDNFSAMIAGGGLTRGRVLGASTRDGAYAADRPVHYREILATVYDQLGIDPTTEVYDRENRAHRICPDAEPILELL